MSRTSTIVMKEIIDAVIDKPPKTKAQQAKLLRDSNLVLHYAKRGWTIRMISMEMEQTIGWVQKIIYKLKEQGRLPNHGRD